MIAIWLLIRKWTWNQRKKTKILISNKKIITQFTLCGETIEQIDTFKYLGFEITNNNQNKKHNYRRKTLAYTALAKMVVNGFVNVYLNPYIKGRMVQTFIRSVLMYKIKNSKLSDDECNGLKKTEGIWSDYWIFLNTHYQQHYMPPLKLKQHWTTSKDKN